MNDSYEVRLEGSGKNFYFSYLNIATEEVYTVRVGESDSCTCQSFYSNCRTSMTCKHLENAKIVLKKGLSEEVLMGGVVQIVKPLKKNNKEY